MSRSSIFERYGKELVAALPLDLQATLMPHEREAVETGAAEFARQLADECQTITDDAQMAFVTIDPPGHKDRRAPSLPIGALLTFLLLLQRAGLIGNMTQIEEHTFLNGNNALADYFYGVSAKLLQQLTRRDLKGLERESGVGFRFALGSDAFCVALTKALSVPSDLYGADGMYCSDALLDAMAVRLLWPAKAGDSLSFWFNPGFGYRCVTTGGVIIPCPSDLDTTEALVMRAREVGLIADVVITPADCLASGFQKLFELAQPMLLLHILAATAPSAFDPESSDNND